MTHPAAPKRFASSRRVRLLLWLLVLLVAGVGTFLGTHFSNTAEVTPKNPIGPIPQENIPFPKDAWRVAHEFVFTALARKNLARSYEISDSTMRSGLTLKQWKTGTLPNLPYVPIAKIVKYNWKNTNFVRPREAQINVVILPTKSLRLQPIIAQIALKKFGKGSNGRWLVDYFSSISPSSLPVPGPDPHL